MKLLDLVRPEAIIAELESTNRNGVIRELVAILGSCGAIRDDWVDTVVKTIVTRERSRGTTAFGKGVAVPHAKVAGLSAVVVAVGRSSRGIDFAALDGEPVFGVFLILSPDEKPEEHLRAMDLVYRHLLQERFRKFLRQSDQPAKILDLLKEADESTASL
ncbi:PTS system fructose-specific EIIABC component [Phycisphaerae bacterium RAS1]|nr:PTS system fructose-specific EIIABC component [Phycisphaerae bacterium RAS1]